jgi:hypothetical protein
VWEANTATWIYAFSGNLTQERRVNAFLLKKEILTKKLIRTTSYVGGEYCDLNISVQGHKFRIQTVGFGVLSSRFASST